MRLNEQIKNARRVRNITQKKLGEVIGYSEAQICHIEKGNRKVKHEDVHRIETYLDVQFIRDSPFIKREEKIEKLYKIIKLVFGAPDNYKKIEEIWNK